MMSLVVVFPSRVKTVEVADDGEIMIMLVN